MSTLTGRLEKETQFYEKMDAKLKNLPPVINEYYISLRANRKAYTSINVYINNLLHFVNFACGDNIKNDFYKTIVVTDIERYFISLETKKTSSGTKRMGDDVLQQRWSSLNHFFNFLLTRKYIDENPIAGVSRPKNNTEHQVTFLTKVEINKLLKATDNNPNKVMGLRDKTIISLALATGLRISAMINLNIQDIDFDNGIINVIEKRQKVRSIAIGANVKKMLQHWIQVRNKEYGNVASNALFLSRQKNRISPDALNEMLAKYCDEIGLGKHITFHKLRSSAACQLAKAGLPVKAIAKQLGHSNISITMRYIDVFKEDEEKVLNVLDGLV